MFFWFSLGALSIYVLFRFLCDQFDAVELAKEKAFRKPISSNEVAAALELMEATTLPMVSLELERSKDSGPADTKLGGGLPWVPDTSQKWPVSETGVPLCFLAQINFAQLPAMQDFPRKGLLQVFAAITTTLSIADGSAHAEQHPDIFHVVRWYSDPVGGYELTRPVGVNAAPDAKLATPFYMLKDLSDSEWDKIEAGAGCGWAVETALAFVRPPAYVLPQPHSALFCNDYGAAPRPVLSKSARKALRGLDDESVSLGMRQRVHRVGGHPIYLTPQQRNPSCGPALDRVLLQLVYQLDGKGIFQNFMTLAISQEHLRSGEMEMAQFFWSDDSVLDDE
ncbi:MAG: DUF1963 domain-containing protein [Pseudomonadota bacterium]